MAGRKKVPTQLRIIKGNPGKRPLPKNEPKLAVVTPSAPKNLTPEAKKHWRKTVKHLADAKLMTVLDVTALMLYCSAYSTWLDANSHLVDEGSIVWSPNGYPMQSPWLGISNKAFDQMKSILVEFGMTPSSRSKVTTIADESGSIDPWSQI